jgi:hypothetical protein
MEARRFSPVRSAKPLTLSVLFGVLKGREMGDFLQIELAHCVLTHFSLCWQMRNA